MSENKEIKVFPTKSRNTNSGLYLVVIFVAEVLFLTIFVGLKVWESPVLSPLNSFIPQPNDYSPNFAKYSYWTVGLGKGRFFFVKYALFFFVIIGQILCLPFTLALFFLEKHFNGSSNIRALSLVGINLILVLGAYFLISALVYPEILYSFRTHIFRDFTDELFGCGSPGNVPGDNIWCGGT